MTAVRVGDVLTADSDVEIRSVVIDRNGEAWQAEGDPDLTGSRWWATASRACEDEVPIRAEALIVRHGPVTVAYVPGETPWLDTTAERMDAVQYLRDIAAALRDGTSAAAIAAGALLGAADGLAAGEHKGAALRAIQRDAGAEQARAVTT